MCGRFVFLSEEKNSEIDKILKGISEKYKDQSLEIALGDIYPTNLAPVVTKENNDKDFNLFKWGFPLPKEKGSLLINARGETLEEKVTFKNLLKSKRCVIPASAFYEWKLVGKNKHKYLIKSQDKDFFYMAGLYNTFIDLHGNPYTGFVIITTAANEQMSAIHHRMPLILSSQEEVELWIDNTSYDLASLKYLIRPYSGKLSVEGETLSLFD
jgi:putative SOS response-associated peptidase YedK